MIRRALPLLAIAALALGAACAPVKKGTPLRPALFYFVIDGEPDGTNMTPSFSPQLQSLECGTGTAAAQQRNADGSIVLGISADPTGSCGAIAGFGVPAGTVGGLTGTSVRAAAGSALVGLGIATDGNGDGLYGGKLGGSGFGSDVLCFGETGGVTPPGGGSASLLPSTALDCETGSGPFDSTLAGLKQGASGVGTNTPVAILVATTNFDEKGAVIALVTSTTVNGVEMLVP
jgi:hypothetical protein